MEPDICPNTGFPCPKPKLFHITDIAEGQVTQRDVCEDCVHNKPDATIATMVEFIDFLFKKQPISTEVPVDVEPVAELSCPCCGTTPSEIRQTKKLGCMVCYEIFENQLKDVLWKSHKGLKHVGKVPKQWEKENMTIDQMLVKVQIAFNQSLRNEQYEDAALLNEKLQKLTTLKEREVVVLDQIHAAISDEDYEKAHSYKNALNEIKTVAVEVFS